MRAKKIITGVTAFALMGAVALPVSAQDNTETKDTTIKANIQSTYTLTIPAETDIAFEATSTSLNGTLKVTGNVLPSQEVEVTAQAKDFHNHAQNADLPYKLMNGQEEFKIATWNETELRNGFENSQNAKEIQLSIAIEESNWKTAKAGDYEGSITFTANLQNVQSE